MSEKSALRLIPGRDALLEYTPKAYNAKTYVEYQGLVYKSKVSTSPTFISTEWELIGDLREIRVNNIADRNALTGSTPTSGTTGINIPILDNTNVLVLNAIADPLVAANKFARYNYNKLSNSFLLLQISTGSTSSNVSNYNLLTNKPSIISGVTATAGVGLTGGGVFNGSVPPNRASFSFAHADTSAQANIVPTGRTYIQQLRFDTFGHVTGGTTSSWTHPDTSSQANVSNTGFTYIQSVQLDGDGHVASLGSATWVHPDTSTQGSVNNTGSTVIQSITVDGAGHVTGISSATVSGGGGGFSGFNVIGDVGGTRVMPNSGNLRITGGTGIQTVTTLNGANLGVRLNVLGAGSTNQVQYNGGGGLSASNLFVFSAGTGTLRTANLVLSAAPVSGITTDQIITRNPTTGAIQRLGTTTLFTALSANNGINKIGNNFRLGGALTGNTQILGAYDFNLNIRAFTLGVRVDTSGTYSVVFGNNNSATGLYSFAQGNNTIASGTSSFAGGSSSDSSKKVYAQGFNSFAYSTNDAGQTAGHGALGYSSTILGGRNHNIDVGNAQATIVGGSNIKLTGSSYTDYTAVSNLAIFSTPIAGGTNDVLTWNPTNKKIGRVTQASLAGAAVAAGSDRQIQFNNSGLLGASNGLLYSGTTLVATGSLTIGARSAGTIGSNSATIGLSNIAQGSMSFAGGGNSIARSTQCFAFGINASASGSTSFAIGSNTKAHAAYAFAGGNGSQASGTTSMAFGNNAKATAIYSVAFGSGTNATNTASFAISTNSLASGTNSFAGQGGIASGSSSVALGTNCVASHFAFAAGSNSKAYANSSIALGSATAYGASSFASNLATAIGQYSHAQNFAATAHGQASSASGRYSVASGQSSWVGGNGFITKNLVVSGTSSFMFSENTTSQTAGHGNMSNNSVILGGVNMHLAPGNDRAVLLGGNAVKVSTSGYADHVIVPNLAIFTTPSAGGVDDVLTWNATSKKVGKVTQGSISDERLKTDLKPLVGVVDKIASLGAFEFKYNDTFKAMEGTDDYGLIAQQVEEVFPHVVKDNITVDNVDYKTVDYRKLVPVLFAAIKELNDKIKALEGK